MSPPGLGSYDHGAKAEWRQWQWDAVAAMLPVPVEKATVLYLSGPDDRDRREARLRGFRPEGLVAVDTQEEHVKRIRSRRGLAVRGDLCSVLREWPRDWRVHAVIADLCGGLTRDAHVLALTVTHAPALTAGCVVSVNLKRGRDAWSNPWRPQLARHYEDVRTPRGLVSIRLHRAAQWWALLPDLTLAASGRWVPAWEVAKARRIIGDRLVTWTYKSTPSTVMDSGVCVLPYHIPAEIEGSDTQLRQQIIAVRAVRTRHMRRWGVAE